MKAEEDGANCDQGKELERMKLCFVALSFVFIIFAAMAIARHYSSEWRICQREYYRLLAAKTYAGRRAGEGHSERKRSLRIRQVYNKDLHLVDRCTTCHLGVEEPLMAGAERVEFRLHPQRNSSQWDALKAHPREKFGCTTCHQGQGRATIAKDAHGDVRHWKKPLLRDCHIEASCGRCHKADELEEAPILTKGRGLLVKNGCVGCHIIEGSGLTFGPELTDVAFRDLNGDGERNDEDWQWMFEHFKDPEIAWETREESGIPEPIMPIKFIEEDARALTVAMLTLTGEEVSEKYIVPTTFRSQPKSVVDRGRLIFERFGCAGCHGVGGGGGVKNPNTRGGEVPALYKLADKVVFDKEEAGRLLAMLQRGVELDAEESWLEEFFKIRTRLVDGKKPEKEVPNGPAPPLYMPSFKDKIKGRDLDYLIAYVISLFPDDRWEDWDADEGD